MERGNASAQLNQLDLLHMMADHPESARQLHAIQEQLHNISQVFIQKLATEIHRAKPSAGSTSATNAQPLDVTKLRAASAKARIDTLASKQSAEELVFSLITNSDNPNWNPEDPSTYRNPEDSFLLKIMSARMGVAPITAG